MNARLPTSPDLDARLLAAARASLAKEDSRLQMERGLEGILKDYITKPEKFRFGGVVNLVSTLEKVLKECAEEYRCADYEVAARRFAELENALDMRYEHAEG